MLRVCAKLYIYIHTYRQIDVHVCMYTRTHAHTRPSLTGGVLLAGKAHRPPRRHKEVGACVREYIIYMHREMNRQIYRYICIYVCMCVYIYILYANDIYSRMHAHHAYKHKHHIIYIHTYTCITHTEAHTYIYTHTHTHTHISICIHIYIYMYVYMYIYINI